MIEVLTVAAAVLVALFRPFLLLRDFNPHLMASYQAAAHILVGWLLGNWYMHRQLWKNPQCLYTRGWLINTFWILTAIEVTCAAVKVLSR